MNFGDKAFVHAPPDGEYMYVHAVVAGHALQTKAVEEEDDDETGQQLLYGRGGGRRPVREASG